MYEYDEYFDTDLRSKPYNSSEEELFDYLKIIDMILESLLENRGIHSENKLFSKGLVITEKELKAYYGIPPVLRKIDSMDPTLFMAVSEAFDYISERAEHTGKKVPYLRIQSVISKFELDRNELIAVLVSLIGKTDRKYERIFGFLQDDITAKDPTAGLLLTILSKIRSPYADNETVERIVSDKLKKYFFVPSDETGLRFPLILNESMTGILLGQDIKFEDTLGAVLRYEENDDIPLFFEEESGPVTRLTWSVEPGQYYIENDDPDTVLHILYNSAKGTGKELLVLKVKKLLELDDAKVTKVLTDIWVHMTFCSVILAVLSEADTKKAYSEEEKIPGPANDRNFMRRIVKEFASFRVFFFGEENEPYELSSFGIPAINVGFPSAEKRIRMWEYFSSDKNLQISLANNIVIPDFADCHVMPYGKIKSICTHAMATARLLESDTITKDMLLESMLKLNNVDFSSLATRVKAVYTWEDLTIADDQADILHVACDRYKVRNRVAESWGLKKKNAYGNGVSLLLYGPPGTGKTMAAQVIANELSLPLYRIDISRIFSKYIGETEKNLSEIFNAAKGANVILFFDEADALFSKRTEIKDSNDKYSNSETAFLLQKIEEYDGMSILATNYYQNFDNAFIRRITYAAHLDSPDEKQRYLLWTTILPKETKIEEGTDFHFLAGQFELSGSNIKAILYSAAYMAGANGEKLSMKHIARAMQYEYKKLGRLASSSEFGMLMGYL